MPTTAKQSLFALAFSLFLTTSVSSIAHAQDADASSTGSDFISQQVIPVHGPNAESALNLTLAQLRDVFVRYQPALDSSSKITSPATVTGTEAQPRLRLSIEKCVFFVCKTVDIDADITAREVSGPCARNVVLVADLARSSELLTGTYKALQVSACFKPTTAGAGTLTVIAKALRAQSYDSGIVQQQLFQTLKMQTAPIISAIKLTLDINGKK